MQSRQLIKELEAAGWVLERVTGSHHLFKHPYRPETVPFPCPRPPARTAPTPTSRGWAGACWISISRLTWAKPRRSM
nr:type II toxin-antitoxin system HicA family toxin [Pseudomonas chlororaphis]